MPDARECMRESRASGHARASHGELRQTRRPRAKSTARRRPTRRRRSRRPRPSDRRSFRERFVQEAAVESCGTVARLESEEGGCAPPKPPDDEPDEKSHLSLGAFGLPLFIALALVFFALVAWFIWKNVERRGGGSSDAEEDAPPKDVEEAAARPANDVLETDVARLLARASARGDRPTTGDGRRVCRASSPARR